MFGGHETLVPLVNASADGSELTVPYTKDTIKNAPHHDPAGELSNQQEAELFSHYGVPYSGETVTADTGRTAAPAAPPTSAPATTGRASDDAMTRSEEQLRVGTQQVEGWSGPAAQACRRRDRDQDGAGLPRGAGARAGADH